jgi:hypothetical protein
MFSLDSGISTQGPTAGFCEHGNEPLDFTKTDNFLVR